MEALTYPHIRDRKKWVLEMVMLYAVSQLSLMYTCLYSQGVRLGVRPDAPALPRPSKAVKVESGCNVANPCLSSPCPSHSRCTDLWERHACICEPGE